MDTFETAIRSTVQFLDEKGWCQKRFTDSDGRHCVYGALQFVISNLDLFVQLNIIRVLNDRTGSNLIEWNDKPGQTYKNVRRTLLEIADSP